MLTPRPVTAVLAIAAFLTACGGGDKATEPLVPGGLTAIFTAPTSAAAGGQVGTAPAIKVTTTSGTALANVAVTFAVASGGGSLSAPTQTTNAQGIATVGAWTLGPTVGVNTMTATVANLSPITFSVTSVAGPAAKLTLTTAATATGVNRQALATQPSLQLQDINSNSVAQAGTVVTASIGSGGGAVGGTASATTNASGVATFTDLSVSGTVGTRSIAFSATALNGATLSVTTTAGTATQMAMNAGDAQTALPGTAVPTAPSVKVSDADANAVAGASVTFAVASGGGSITGGSQVTNASGIATVGSWTLGPSQGANTLSATSGSLSGSPVTITATATSVAIASVSPATLTPGITATITGQGFDATLANNAVTIDGVSATVTAASATQVTLTVPSSLACSSLRDISVSLTTGGTVVAKTHPLRVATVRTLSAGQSVIISGAADSRCNEISSPGGSYYVNVYNTSTTYSPTGAPFELRGTAATTFANAPAQMREVRGVPSAIRNDPVLDQAERTHARVMDENRRILMDRRGQHVASAQSRMGQVPTRSNATVGEFMTIRIPRVNQAGFCSNYKEITARVAYVGTKAIVVEDQANQMVGGIDTTYAQIGQEFDDTMFPILETNYGNLFAMDASLDNNGRIIMVFSKVVNDSMAGLAGFVVSCDLFARGTSSNTSSNFGEYFYAQAPTAAGNINVAGSPPRWRWGMRGTIIHEAKHIVSFVERVSRNASTYEASWLEETTARISEELFERARYGFAQRANLGYGSAANQVGPYCGVRLACGQARGIVRVFEELHTKWYKAPELYSPLGRLDGNDFSFYATGWSLVRWALDYNTTKTEAAMLKGLTQDNQRNGVANFEFHLGTTFADALPRWTLANIVDDYPGATISDQSLKQPSWDFRNVMQGINTDFPSSYTTAWPLTPFSRSLGTFSVTGSTVPGTSAIVLLSGAPGSSQLIELKASGSNAAAPSELRLAIVRVE